MAYMRVDVDIDMDQFEDQDLIDELEERGYHVMDDENPATELTDVEIDAIVELFENSKPGTIGHDIYDKLRKR